MLLQDKVAIIYGAGGAIGSAVARAFGAEGARVFLSGRTLGRFRLSPGDCRSGWIGRSGAG
jgi:NAD(P)-dependent dehydrogenase (short-subunit alcohol dehydrogenase family)